MTRRGLGHRALLAFAVLLLAGLAPIASAQYKWVDESGRVVYSDRPPIIPRAGVQVMRGGSLVAAPTPVTGPASAGAATSSSADPGKPAAGSEAPGVGDSNPSRRPSGADTAAKPGTAPALPAYVERDLAFRKRQQERETAERKQVEQNQQAAQLARVCEDRRTDLRTLETGGRLRRVDANGEASFMTEEDIAQRRESLKKSISAECRPG